MVFVMVKCGISCVQALIVQPKMTAAAYGSGHLEVYATPAMVAFMENTAIRCLEGHLEPGTDTVGIKIDVEHVKATAVNKQVSCEAKVVEVDGRRIRFEVEAWDDGGVIGRGVHDRFVIDPEKFMSKLK